MKAHYSFIQFAHTIRQVLEQGNLHTKSLMFKLKEVSTYIVQALISPNPNLMNIEINFQLRFDT